MINFGSRLLIQEVVVNPDQLRTTAPDRVQHVWFFCLLSTIFTVKSVTNKSTGCSACAKGMSVNKQNSDAKEEWWSCEMNYPCLCDVSLRPQQTEKERKQGEK